MKMKQTISVVDVYGNILYTLSPRLIRPGQNLIQLHLTGRLRNYANYFIKVNYMNFNDAIKIFVVK
jgi:hypothetical protein